MAMSSSRADGKSSIEAATEAIAKVNAMLIAKGKLKPSQLNPHPGVKKLGPQSSLLSTEVEINDVPIGCRNMLTRGATQEEISKLSGAAVATRGRYLSPEERAKNPSERALYLSVQASNKQALDMAVGRINEIIANGIARQGAKMSKFSPPIRGPGPHQMRGPQPGFMQERGPAPNMPLFQEKLFIGLEHAPPNFSVKDKILGPGGSFLQHVQAETGCKVTLRGKGSGFIEPNGTEAMEPMHVHLQHVTGEGLQQAKGLATNLIQTVQQEYAAFQQSFVTMPPPNMMPQQPPYLMPPQQRVGIVNPPQIMPGQPPASVSIAQPGQVIQQQQQNNFVPPPQVVQAGQVIQTQQVQPVQQVQQVQQVQPAPGQPVQQFVQPNDQQIISGPISQPAPMIVSMASTQPPGQVVITSLGQPPIQTTTVPQIVQQPQQQLPPGTIQVAQPQQQVTVAQPQQQVAVAQPQQIIQQQQQPVVQQSGVPIQTQPGVPIQAQPQLQQQQQPQQMGIPQNVIQQQQPTMTVQPQMIQQAPQQQQQQQQVTTQLTSNIQPGVQQLPTSIQTGIQQQIPAGIQQIQQQQQQLAPPTLQTVQPGTIQQQVPGGVPAPTSWGQPASQLQPVQAGTQLQTMTYVQPAQSQQNMIMTSSQPQAAVSTTPAVSAPVTATPTPYVYSTGPKEEPKRRFTEIKQEEKLPENLLGYEHGPPHLANLVVQPGQPSQQQQQQQPIQQQQQQQIVQANPGQMVQIQDGGMPPQGGQFEPGQPQPGQPQPMYQGQVIQNQQVNVQQQQQQQQPQPEQQQRLDIDERQQQVGTMSPGPQPTFIQQQQQQQQGAPTGDQMLMPPPPPPAANNIKRQSPSLSPGPDIKKMKSLLDDDDDGDIPSSIASQVKELKKYSYNQISNAPQLYQNQDSNNPNNQSMDQMNNMQPVQTGSMGDQNAPGQTGPQHPGPARSPGGEPAGVTGYQQESGGGQYQQYQSNYQYQSGPPSSSPNQYLGNSQPQQSGFSGPWTSQSYNPPSSSPQQQTGFPTSSILQPPPPPPLMEGDSRPGPQHEFNQNRDMFEGRGRDGFNPGPREGGFNPSPYGRENRGFMHQPPPPPPPPRSYW